MQARLDPRKASPEAMDAMARQLLARLRETLQSNEWQRSA